MIEEITGDGYVTVTFSDEFLVPEDLGIFKGLSSDIRNGEFAPNLLVFVNPEEG